MIPVIQNFSIANLGMHRRTFIKGVGATGAVDRHDDRASRSDVDREGHPGQVNHRNVFDPHHHIFGLAPACGLVQFDGGGLKAPDFIVGLATSQQRRAVQTQILKDYETTL